MQNQDYRPPLGCHQEAPQFLPGLASPANQTGDLLRELIGEIRGLRADLKAADYRNSDDFKRILKKINEAQP